MNTSLIEFLAMGSTSTDANGQSAPSWTGMIPIVLMIVMFYFLLIRPQMKARKDQDRLMSNLKSGDEIVTTAGILGTVTNVKEKTVTVRIADSVKVEMLKSAIASVTKSDEVKAA